MNRNVEWLLCVCLCWVLLGCAKEPERVIVLVDNISAHVELANTEETRQKGLMHRQSLGKDEGLLIAFPEPQPIALWMLNTPLPLDVGFFDAQGRLFQIISMVPDGGKTTHYSIQPGQYALEMNQGWFNRHGIKVGARLTGQALQL